MHYGRDSPIKYLPVGYAAAMSILLLLVTVVISAAIAKILFTEQPGRGLTGMPIVEGNIRYVLLTLIVVAFFFPIYWILITTMKPQERYLVPGMTMGASRSAARPARLCGCAGQTRGAFPYCRR